MKKLLTISAAALLLSCCLCSVGIGARAKLKPIIVEGTVLAISPVIGEATPSGLVPHYRLVKYRVERVCRGKYGGDDIVIDHSITDEGDELKDVKVGDRVYVLFHKWKNEGDVRTYKGIREATEGLKHVYRAAGVIVATSPGCAFNERDFVARH